MKLLIIGQGRHGKDTIAEIWKVHFGLTFTSSSLAAAKIFMYESLKEKHGYNSFKECYEDRHNNRKEWYNEICDYNKKDKSRLCKEILKDNDCYVGMRDLDEAFTSRRLFDLIIYVDASTRVKELDETMKIPKGFADIIITNNETLGLFHNKAMNLGRLIFN